MTDGCSGICCAVHGWTPLKVGEPEKIAQYLEIPVEDFRERYVRTYGVWIYSLGWDGKLQLDKENEEGIKTGNPCPFWMGGLCGIQEVKPEACAKYVGVSNRKCIHSWLEREECIRQHMRMIK